MRNRLEWNLETVVKHGLDGVVVPLQFSHLVVIPQRWAGIKVRVTMKSGNKLRTNYRFQTGQSMTVPQLSRWLADRVKRELGTDDVHARVEAEIAA
jgi:hypothetical protein